MRKPKISWLLFKRCINLSKQLGHLLGLMHVKARLPPDNFTCPKMTISYFANFHKHIFNVFQVATKRVHAGKCLER